MTYGESIAYLHSLSQFGFRPGLQTTLDLAAAVGNPEAELRFIHVAGTNGKGSTCAMLESIYRHAGLRVGLYTSPHLVKFGERIQVGRKMITDTGLARLTTQLAAEASARGIVPTFFEFTTVLALMWFAESRCELVIWETGLGGRLDSTNIVTPIASVITSIGWDHMHILGKTLTAIAGEKAGIIKPGVPTIAPEEPAEARAAIEARAGEMGAPLRIVGASEAKALPYEVALLGEHQRANAAVACATVEMLQPLIPVSPTAIKNGLALVVWMGRFQLIRHGQRTVLLDGAHNRDGIEALRKGLEQLHLHAKPAFIVGILADKEWETIASRVAGMASRVWTVSVASQRSLAPEALRGTLKAAAPDLDVTTLPSLAEALAAAVKEPFLVVTGSLYLIGEAIECLGIQAAPVGNQRELNEWGGRKS